MRAVVADEHAEQERLAQLHEYGLLDAPAGDELEAVVRLAVAGVGVPFGTLNIIDEHRQCQLTSVGFAGTISARSDSMCATHFRNGRTVWTRDASADPAYWNNPWVTGRLGDVKFYASAPLITPSGYALGTLCLFDTVPHELDTGQLSLLQDAVAVVVALFERRHQARASNALAADLFAAEQQQRAAFEVSPSAMVVCDEHGRLLRINPAFEALVGRPATELTGMNWRDLTHPDDRVSGERHESTAVSEPEAVESFEKRFVRPDGTVVWAAVRITAMPANGGPKLLGQAQDITERKRVERQAARENARLRTTVAVQRELTGAASDRDELLRVVADRTARMFEDGTGVIVSLLDDDQVMRVVAVTPELTHLMGRTAEEALAGLIGEVAGPVLSTLFSPRPGAPMIAPLFASDGVIGAVAVLGGPGVAFDENDAQQLTLLADAIGGALRHADDTARNTRLLARANDAVAALAASENRFRLGFEHSPLGMLLTGLRGPEAGTFLRANAAMGRITGYPAAALAGMKMRDLSHPDELDESMSLLDDLAAGRVEHVTAEKRYWHADGRYVWVRLHVAVVRDERDEPDYLVTQVEDIDAEKAAATQLAERAQLLDLTQDAVVVRSLDGRIRYWNPAAERIYGWSARTASGHDLDRLLATVWQDGDTRATVTAALDRDGEWEGEIEHRRADGRRVAVHTRKTLQRDTEGRPIGVLSISTDVTARKVAERALADSEERFRSQFAHSTAGQMIRGLDDGIEDVNPAFAAMLGHTREELIGTKANALFTAETLDARLEGMARMFAGETDAITAEMHLVRADGSLIDVLMNVSVVRGPSGDPLRFVGIFQDITDRKRAEAERDAAMSALAAKNTQLEDANQLKLDMIGMLGHEIGNPLSAIMGYAEHALDSWDALPPAKQLDIVAIIERNAQRLDSIVREVLAMVTLDAGKLTAHPEPTALRTHLESAAGDTLPVACPDDLVALVQPGHLDQIVTNLLSNAGKYGGGATALRAHRDGDTIQISVEDRGAGVPPEFRAQLFERFARSDATAGRVKGTGLGLYIVRELARANRGDVGYAPNPAGGSIFTLILPAAR